MRLSICQTHAACMYFGQATRMQRHMHIECTSAASVYSLQWCHLQYDMHRSSHSQGIWAGGWIICVHAALLCTAVHMQAPVRASSGVKQCSEHAPRGARGEASLIACSSVKQCSVHTPRGARGEGQQLSRSAKRGCAKGGSAARLLLHGLRVAASSNAVCAHPEVPGVKGSG